MHKIKQATEAGWMSGAFYNVPELELQLIINKYKSCRFKGAMSCKNKTGHWGRVTGAHNAFYAELELQLTNND